MDYRNEWKYTIRKKERILLEENISKLLEKDVHSTNDGKYVVKSCILTIILIMLFMTTLLA